MDFISALVNFLKKTPEQTKGKSPEGVCPICWGYNEYDGKIRKVYKDKQVAVNNHKDSYMLIQEFVVNHIDGIRLKEGEWTSCPTCGTKHEKKHSKRNGKQKIC